MTLSEESDQVSALRLVPMHVLRVIGMRLRIGARTKCDEAIPDRMLKILDDLDWRERCDLESTGKRPE